MKQTTATPAPIKYFTGEFYFLSNFYPCTVKYDGMVFRNAEAAFQSAKCAIRSERRDFQYYGAHTARQKGRLVKLRKDWEKVKVRVMREVLLAKFDEKTNPQLWKQLCATFPRQLIEGNWWRDYFWGVHDGKGENKLGQLLMEIREVSF